MAAGPTREQVSNALRVAASKFANELKDAVGNPHATTFITGRGDRRDIAVHLYGTDVCARVEVLRASNGEAAVARCFANMRGIGSDCQASRSAVDAARALSLDHAARVQS